MRAGTAWGRDSQLLADVRMVVVHGLVGNIVAEKNRQLLVCFLKEEQRIKESWKFKKQYTMRKNIPN